MIPRVGLVKNSFVDYPGEIAATLFTAGCNLRCPYCHNPQLVSREHPDEFVPLREVLQFFENRRGRIGAACITGGEPLLQPWIPELVSALRERGLKVKLDTNGLLPERLAELRLDYIAIDLKLAPIRYPTLGGPEDPTTTLSRTITWARENVPQVEFRTTVVPGLVRLSDVEEVVAQLDPGDRLTLAAFRQGATLDPAYGSISPPEPATMDEYRQLAEAAGLHCEVRENRATTRRAI